MSEAEVLETESPELEEVSSPEKEDVAVAEIAEETVEVEKEVKAEIDPDQFHGLERKTNKQRREIREGHKREAELKEQLRQAQAPSEPVADNYESQDEYIDARIKYGLSQGKTEEAYNPVDKIAHDLKSAGNQKYKDFDTVAFASEDMLKVLDDFDAPEDIAYYLGQNPTEVEKFKDLSNIGMAREFGKIEAKLNQPKPRTSKAPEPIKPLETGETIEVDEDNETVAQYAARMNKRRGYR